MAKFILNRPDVSLSLSKKQIIGTTLMWLVILMAGAVLLKIACTAIYMSMGVNPMELTQFGGDPTHCLFDVNAQSDPGWPLGFSS